MDDYRQTVSEYLQSQYTFELGVSNIIDVKTSIIVALIIFLAVQWRDLFNASSMPHHWQVAQWFAGGFLFFAILAALEELRPRNYPIKRNSVEFLKRVEEFEKTHSEESEPGSMILEDIRNDEVSRTNVFKQIDINKDKILAMTVSFWFTVAALFLNLATQAALAFGWRF